MQEVYIVSEQFLNYKYVYWDKVSMIFLSTWHGTIYLHMEFYKTESYIEIMILEVYLS